MKISISHRVLGLAAVLLLTASLAYGQGEATAAREISLSGFGMGTGTYTGINGGRNIAFTAGFDLGLHPIGSIRPEIELRGTEPVDSGGIVGEKNALGGVKFTGFLNSRLHPYGDVLIGRGKMNYAGTGYVVGSVAYQYTSSIVYAFGGGADYDLTGHFPLKGDYQMQRWLTPVTTSGAAYPQAISFGIIYRINIGRLPIGKQR